MLRCVRPDKCVPAIQNFVEASIGRRFIEPPPFDLHAAFNDSSVNLPLIFILSSGADPVNGLLIYAESAGMGDPTASTTSRSARARGPRRRS